MPREITVTDVAWFLAIAPIVAFLIVYLIMRVLALFSKDED